MNTKGLTSQQKGVAVNVQRCSAAGAPPTTRELGEMLTSYIAYPGGVPWWLPLGYDRANAVIRALVRRGIVEQAGMDGRARTWRLTAAAQAVVGEWARELDIDLDAVHRV